jgi:hypothetical protein
MAWTSAKFGGPTGWIAFLFLIGSYGFASRATTALTDMLLTCLLFAAYILVFPLAEGMRSKGRTGGAAILIGLAVLAKGPVALVLMGFAIAIYSLLARRNPLALAARGWPWAIAAGGLAIAAVWYVPAFLEGRAAGFATVFVDENFGHFMPASMGGTGEAARPFYYVAIRLMGGMLPLSLLTPALMLAIVGDDPRGERGAAFRYQLALAISVLVLFSIASAKRDDYILPAIPPLAILFSTLFSEGRGTPTKRAQYAALIRDITVALICGLMLVGTLALFFLMRIGGNWGRINLRLESSDASYAAIFSEGLAHLSVPYVLAIVAMAAGATVSFAGIWRHRPAWSGAGLGVIAVAGSVLWTGVIRPAETRTRSVGPFTAAVRERVGGGQLFVAYDDPEFAYYAGWGVPALPRAIARNGPRVGQTIYLVARPRELTRLAPTVRSHLEPLIQSRVLGGGGPPALYLMRPGQTSGVGAGLKGAAGSNK